MKQLYLALKNIKTRKNKYQAGEIIEISNPDAIKTLLEQEAIMPIHEAFEWQFQNLSEFQQGYPLDFQSLRKSNPDAYDRLMELADAIDRSWLKQDYKAFVEAINNYMRRHFSAYLSKKDIKRKTKW